MYIMEINHEDFQKARRISREVLRYLEEIIEDGLRSTDIYPILAKKGLIEKDRHNGLHFRRFLRKLKDNDLLKLIPQCHARNLILLLMVFMQNFHAFNCRSERVSAFKVPIKRNIILVFGVFAAQALHILSMQIPFMQNMLRIEPVTFNEWFYILALAVPMILTMEVFKYFRRSKT